MVVVVAMIEKMRGGGMKRRLRGKRLSLTRDATAVIDAIFWKRRRK